MFEPHPDVNPPSNPDVPIWSYMDLARLVSLLSHRALWFSRADLLGDPHEGAVGARGAEERRRRLHAESEC